MTYKFGRKVPRARSFGLRMGDYLDLSKITIPAETRYGENARACLDQMLLNDKLSCCMPAACFHLEAVWQGNAGLLGQKFSNAQVSSFYGAATGWDSLHSESTDNGSDMGAVLNYWMAHGLYKSGHKIAGHAKLNSSRIDTIRASVFLFQNAIAGTCLPQEWQDPEPEESGFLWDLAGEPDREAGHAWLIYDLVKDGTFRLSTWGLNGRVTPKAISYYGAFDQGGEMHVAFSYDSINMASKKAPNGLKADELWNDFKKFGH